MRFYEQLCNGRVIISSDIVAKNDGIDQVIDSRDADCWIDAKRRLGYVLTSVQEFLLADFYKKRDQQFASA